MAAAASRAEPQKARTASTASAATAAAARAQRLGILSGGRLSIRQGTWQASL